MIISKALATIAYSLGFATQEVPPVYHSIIEVPIVKKIDELEDSLNQTPRKSSDNVLLISGVQQEDCFSCGYWSLFHAKIIQTCVENNIPISNTTLNIASEYNFLINKKMCKENEFFAMSNGFLYTDGIYHVNNIPNENNIKHIGLTNLSILGDIHGELWLDDQFKSLERKLSREGVKFTELYNLHRDESAYTDEDRRQLRDENDKIETKIKNNALHKQNMKLDRIKANLLQDPEQAKTHHFLCNLNSIHWILISVIRLPFKQPILLIVDSSNPTAPPESSFRYINFLKNKFINLSPEEISHISSKKLEAIKMVGVCQKDETCGYWSSFHAYAIEKCIENNESINQQSLCKYAESLESLITKKEMLEATDIDKLITDNKMNNVSILEFMPHFHKSFWLYDCYKLISKDTMEISIRLSSDLESPQLTPRDKNDIRNKYDKLQIDSVEQQKASNSAKINALKRKFLGRSNSIRAHHFICNLDNCHWIVISIIKFPNQQIKILIIDSLCQLTPEDKKKYNKDILPIIQNYVIFLKQQLIDKE